MHIIWVFFYAYIAGAGIRYIGYQIYWVSDILGIRYIGYRIYWVSEILGIRNIRYQVHKVKFHLKLLCRTSAGVIAPVSILWHRCQVKITIFLKLQLYHNGSINFPIVNQRK